ncbi:conserved hypothetical protein [Paraburkholderia piptadeniae]|uniref:Uncharacterized protein n=2 Tax=Paraburkholderia piptadeniae TaxID=1701573 RepID=A0A1N7RLY1_9BURK|nr:conserved hypothetical protein [Paraburkholderia piptadeniae]
MTDGDHSPCKRYVLRPKCIADALDVSLVMRASLLALAVAMASGCDSASADNAQAPVWTKCADEHGTCSFSGTRDVRYGTEARNTVKSLTNGTSCDNGVFDDPAPGEEKQCWISGSNSAAGASGAAAKASGTPAASPRATADNDARQATAQPYSSHSQALRCNGSPDVAAANPQGGLIEADTPDSDGTRLFTLDRSFRVAITTRASRNDKLAWQIRDAWGTVQASGAYEVAQGARQVTLNCTSTLAGYFALSASLEQEHGQLPARGTRPEGIATFGVLPDVSASVPPVHFARADLHRFGGQGTAFVAQGQHCCDGDGYRPLYPQLGLTWVNDNRNWYTEEPDRANTFDPATAKLSPWFRKGDLLRLIQLDGFPGWASPTGKQTHSYLPKSTGALREYMQRVGTESSRVRTTVFAAQSSNYYQVTWEPDAGGGLPWKDTDANFVELYKAVYEGIHATDPNAVVMGPTYGSVTGNIESLRRLAPLGLAKYLDGIAIHGYYDPNGPSPSHPPERLMNASDPQQAQYALPTSMRALRRLMAAQYKPGAKLFATETGISYDVGEQYGPHYPTGDVLYAQGAVVARTHLILLGEGADMTYIFYSNDTPDATPGYGVFFDLDHPKGDFGPGAISPKPAALAVAAMTRLIDGTATLGPVKRTPAGVYAYAFQRLNGGKIVTAAWTHDNAKWNKSTHFDPKAGVPWRLQVDAPGTSGKVTVFDMMGNPSSVPYQNGYATLALTETPVYVVSSNAAVMKANVTTPAGYIAP